MTQIQTQYAELIALTQLHLMEKFSVDEWKCVDPGVYDFFKARYSQKKPSVQAVTVPKATPVKRQHFTSQNTPSKVEQNSVPDTISRESLPIKKANAIRSNLAKVGLDPLPPPSSTADFQGIREIVREQYPTQSIVDHIPNTATAKATHSPQIFIFCPSKNRPEQRFLSNLTKAIKQRFGPTALAPAPTHASYKNLDVSTRLIIATAKEAENLPKDIPLLVIEDPSVYIREPQRKPLLWLMICKKLQSSNS